jgi:hypothetical protein
VGRALVASCWQGFRLSLRCILFIFVVLYKHLRNFGTDFVDCLGTMVRAMKELQRFAFACFESFIRGPIWTGKSRMLFGVLVDLLKYHDHLKVSYAFRSSIKADAGSSTQCHTR